MHNLREIIEIAKKTKAELKGKIDFVTVENYLKKFGYTVVFFNTPSGDKALQHCGLDLEYARYKTGVTYAGSKENSVDVIFIDDGVSAEDQRYALYREAGRIILGHMDYPRLTTIGYMIQNLEADVFAFALLNEDWK